MSLSGCPGKPKASVFDLKAITRLLLQPGVLPVFLIKVISGFPSGESQAAHRASGALCCQEFGAVGTEVCGQGIIPSVCPADRGEGWVQPRSCDPTPA